MEIYFFLRRYRYISYQQFVRRRYDVLGKNIRVPLPSCVVDCVMKQFLLEKYNEEFERFRWTDEDIFM